MKRIVCFKKDDKILRLEISYYNTDHEEVKGSACGTEIFKFDKTVTQDIIEFGKNDRVLSVYSAYENNFFIHLKFSMASHNMLCIGNNKYGKGVVYREDKINLGQIIKLINGTFLKGTFLLKRFINWILLFEHYRFS